MSDSGQKSEQPTGKRLDDSRKKGQVAKSKEINSVVLLLTTAVALMLLQGPIGGKVKELTIYIFSSLYKLELNRDILQSYSLKGLALVMSLLLPIFGLLIVASLAIGYAQVGFKITFQPLKPKFSALNPIKGLKNVMFSSRSMFELAKSLTLLTIIGTFTYKTLKAIIEKSTGLIDYSVEEIVTFMISNGFAMVWKMVIALLLLAGADFVWQKRKHKKDLMMSKQEVKEEMKQMEGDPFIKGKIKSKQIQMARSRMMSNVPKADVVITNPTHFAVAIKYSIGQSSAPTVIAKGTDRVALRIKEVAAQHNIPIYEDKPTARALFKYCEIGDEIPANLFKAVAQILAYIYQQKNAKKKKSII